MMHSADHSGLNMSYQLPCIPISVQCTAQAGCTDGSPVLPDSAGDTMHPPDSPNSAQIHQIFHSYMAKKTCRLYSPVDTIFCRLYDSDCRMRVESLGLCVCCISAVTCWRWSSDKDAGLYPSTKEALGTLGDPQASALQSSLTNYVKNNLSTE